MKASLTSPHQNLHRNNALFSNFGLLFWINTSLFLALALAVLLNISQYSFGHYIVSSITLAIIFFLPGQNITALIEKVSHNTFSLSEKIVVIGALTLTLPPLTVSFLGSQFSSWLSTIPLGLAATSWVVAMKWNPFFWEEYRHENANIHLSAGLIITLLISGMFIFQLTNTYYALPDLDPYYWLQQFQNKFQTIPQISLHNHRPLFFAFGYLFIEIAEVDSYAFFKYIIPLLFLSIILPATLLVQRARSLAEALFIYFLPFASASFLLYSTSSLPQSIANLLILFAFYSLLHGALTKQSFFYFFGGFLLFVSNFYHEMSLLLFLPWLGVLLCTQYQKVFLFIHRERLVSLLLAIIGLLLLEIIYPYIDFLIAWAQKIIQVIMGFQPNFAFPATYINIDGNAVGWGDAWGVIRYYAFYFGPLAAIATISLVMRSLLTQSSFKFIWNSTSWIEKNVILYIITTILLFFGLAEIFPRFFNLSLLPERALGFLACLLVFFLSYRLIRASQVKPLLYIILLIAIGINLGAALYINSVKQYLITTNQINSAEWIRGSLPKEKIFITGTSNNLLRFHAQTDTVIEVKDPSFYTDIRVFEKSLRRIPSPDEQYQEEYSELISSLKQRVLTLENIDIRTDTNALQILFPEMIHAIERFVDRYPQGENIPLPEKFSSPLYIYYSQESSKNPYANRPYVKKERLEETALIFDQYPKRFERVYSLPENEIVIWKMIQ